MGIISEAAYPWYLLIEVLGRSCCHRISSGDSREVCASRDVGVAFSRDVDAMISNWCWIVGYMSPWILSSFPCRI